MDFLCFRCNDSLYAINLSDLCGVESVIPYTAMPTTDAIVVGMMMFRGNLVAVADISQLYNSTATEFNNLLILQSTELYAIFATEIKTVVRHDIPDDSIFIDSHDLYRTILNGIDKSSSTIELF